MPVVSQSMTRPIVPVGAMTVACHSFVGIETSILADATVLAIQAEETRKPVALTLKTQVQDAGGRIAGIALTNRHSYIPDFVYKFL